MSEEQPGEIYASACPNSSHSCPCAHNRFVVFWRTLVYLAAFLIPNGEPMIQTALSDAESLIVSNL